MAIISVFLKASEYNLSIVMLPPRSNIRGQSTCGGERVFEQRLLRVLCRGRGGASPSLDVFGILGGQGTAIHGDQS